MHQIVVKTRGLASGRSYFVVLIEAGLDHWGRYNDQYCEKDGRWLFLERQVIVECAIAEGWGESWQA